MLHPEKILVVRLSSLGDIVMTLPAVYSLKMGLPNSKIHWVCEGSAYELLLCMDFVNEVIKFPRETILRLLSKGNFIESGKVFAHFFRSLREKEYDMVIDFHGILRSVFICLLSRRKRLIGFGKPYSKECSHIFYDERINGEDPYLHKVKRNMLILDRLKIGERFENVPFRVPKEDEMYVEDFFRKEGLQGKIFAVNPFSSVRGFYKRWPLDRYVSLIEKIRKEMEVKFIVLWGTEEEKREAKKLVQFFEKDVIISCPTNVPQLLALFSRTHMYIGGDSGITHVAALAGIPVIAIFGPSDERINSPYGESVKIVKSDAPCSPCKKRKCRERICLEEISSEGVFEVVKSVYREIVER